MPGNRPRINNKSPRGTAEYRRRRRRQMQVRERAILSRRRGDTAGDDHPQITQIYGRGVRVSTAP